MRVLEDGRSLSAVEIKELRPGLQVVVAMNPGPSFAVQNSKGISRYDYLVQALGTWAKNRQGTTLDDWSLLTTGGPEASHVSDSMDWFSAVMTETLNAREITPSLDTLFQAVNLAADPTPRPGMGRAVLFITPPIEGQIGISLENLAAQAQQQGVRIFIWLISPVGAPLTEAGEHLAELANQTGGQLAVFSGEEDIPDPEVYLESLRSIYFLAYDSHITGSGAHELVVEIQTGDGPLTTNTQVFDLDIQPPNPAFISPALEIRRKPPEAQAALEGEISTEAFDPQEHALEVLVDFPDGRMRPLASTSLFVDGVLVAENHEPPFNQFTWDLRAYNNSGPHLLRVEARDSLGLTGSSIETVVNIIVENPEQSVWNSLYRHRPILTVLSVLLAGAVLFLVLLVGGRIRPLTLGVPQRRRRKSDPVTQPVQVRHEPASRRLPNWVNRLQWPQRHVASKAYAFLARITETETAPSVTPIPITAQEVTLGSNTDLATLVLNDASVEALHARLIRKDDGSFRLADEGSVAGTWINYTPVSQEGTQLEHGDLIHIGRVGFRFTLRQPGQVRKPVVTLEEPHKEARP